MALVRVLNGNKIEHVEKFKGKEIRIPAGGSIEMEEDDAVLFKSQFRTPIYDKGRNQTVESKKIISIEPLNRPGAVAQPAKKHNELVCMACGFEAQNKAGLSSHIRTNHKGQMVDDDARKEIEKEG